MPPPKTIPAPSNRTRDPRLTAAAEAVLADIERDPSEQLTPGQARKLLGKADVGAVHRFMGGGRRAADGTRVYLEFAKATSGRITSRSAVRRFLRRLNGLDPAAPTQSQINEAHQRAEARLAAAGL